MNSIKKYFFLIILAFGSSAYAQSNSSSPYSTFGLGLLRGDQLPQYRAMGGLSTGVRTLGGYSNINVSNPAAYSSIRLTTIDVGAYMNRTVLSRDGQQEASGNFALSHINFAIPVSQKSAFSFGLMPYSDMGSTYSRSYMVDTTNVNAIYAGEGGINKAYLGYGVQLGKYLSVGANVSYLFGRVNNVSGIEYPNQIGGLNVKTENKKDVSGLSYDLGVQFHTPLDDKTLLTIGYTNNVGTSLNSTSSYVVTRSRNSITDETGYTPADSIVFREDSETKIKMPMRHSFGVSINRSNKWLLGADVHYAQWSDYQVGNEAPNPAFTDNYGIVIGGQLTPNINSINYLSVMDYRLGIRYDKTYLNIGDQNINDMALTFGLGLPIVAKNAQTAFYKINLSAEIGQRGSLSPGLVKENYFNFNIAFMLNDRWFQRFRYD